MNRRFWHSRARDGVYRLYDGGIAIAEVRRMSGFFGPWSAIVGPTHLMRMAYKLRSLREGKSWAERELAFAPLEALA